MIFRTRAGWLFVHVAPFFLVPVLAAAAMSLTDGARAILCYGALMAMVTAGQSLTVAHRRWGIFTSVGLAAAWVAGGVLITLLDPILQLPESVIIPIAHGGCGLVLGAFQSRALPIGRRRWVLVSSAAWLIAAAVVFPLTRVEWLPGNVRALFPGGAEMTTVLRLMPIYAGITLIAAERDATR